MDYDSLSTRYPQLIYAHIGGFADQPDRVAFDLVLQAETGFLYMNGEPDRNPVKLPVALIDVLAAHQLKQGILLALWQRERQGKGSLVSVTLQEAAIAALSNQATNWLMAAHQPERMGTLHPNIAPYGELLRTADHYQLVLAVGTDKQFEALCQVLGANHLAQHPQYHTNPLRVQHRTALQRELEQHSTRHSADYLLQACLHAQVPIGVVRTLPQVFDTPAAQNMLLHQTLEGQATTRVRTAVFRLHPNSSTP
jgi:crotonobetainyl-CoA:carnitine CoA-transferase CaiB-like acyl-CoA transferase